MSNFTELSIGGRVAASIDADWDDTRAAWNLAADQHPRALAFVERAENANVIRFAGKHDLNVTGQGTGPGAAGGSAGSYRH